jgi:hypothetical protein
MTYVAGIAQATSWKLFPLGDPALHINLPGEVTPMETSVPWDLINRLERFDTYRFYHADGKVVAIFKFIEYNAPIEESADTLMEKEIADVMTTIKAEQILHAEKSIQVKKIPGQKATGSFMLKNQHWVFEDVLLHKGPSMWQVWVAAEESDPAYVKTMNKVVKSIKF